MESLQDYVTIMYALWGLTVPICPLSSYSTVVELQHLLRDSTATRLFVHPRLLPMALEAASKTGLREDRIYILEGNVSGRKSLSEMIDDIQSRKTPAVQSRPVQYNTLAYLLFSSGTSGVPKCVMVSHTNVIFQMHQNAIVNEELEVVMPVCHTIPA
jgi:long-subunit acyl-CoA synthetase (AMP-forming)